MVSRERVAPMPPQYSLTKYSRRVGGRYWRRIPECVSLASLTNTVRIGRMYALRVVSALFLLLTVPVAAEALKSTTLSEQGPDVPALAGTVEDSLGVPVPDVVVQALGTGEQTTTDARGRFRFDAFRSGSYLLRLRRLGFEPLIVPVELPLAADSPLAIELRGSLVSLAPVIVKADGISPRLAATGFADRKLHSGAPDGQFLTRGELERANVIDLGQMLRRMSSRAARCSDGVIFLDGVLMARQPTEGPPTPQRSTVLELQSKVPGVANAAAARAAQEAAQNGSAMPLPSPLDQVPQHWIEGMEVYASPAQIPNEYRAAFREARCVILLWTR